MSGRDSTVRTRMNANRFDRIALVVHPQRELGRELATLRGWADDQGATLVQLASPGREQEVAPPGEVDGADLVVALGGDGTTLAALRAAAPVHLPVLGIACGSLGALTAVTAEQIDDALHRIAAGDWTGKQLPAIVIEREGAEDLRAINDLVLVRGGAGQVMAEIEVDGERFIRLAGDGLVAATTLGSTAYTLAAGGPMLAPGASGMVVTPLAPHGGVCPPLVTGPASSIRITFDPGHGGARIELDGQVSDTLAPRQPVTFTLRLEEAFATLVSLGEHESLIAGLRRRGILVDSPRMLARDGREAGALERPRE
jgi:NAD+ kinase